MNKTWLLAIALALVGYASSDVAASAITPAPASTVRVYGEEALIVYDARAHVEHLVRTIVLESADRDFGVLVPTPAPPQLAEVSPQVFTRLFDVYRVHDAPAPAGQFATLNPFQIEPRIAVEIEDAALVRADATVLDADAARAWLEARGYTSSQATREWISGYARDGWSITAFRIDPGARPFATRAVRMSFATDEPFFPFSEPRGLVRDQAHPLRITVVSNQPMRIRGAADGWRGNIAYRARGDARLASALRGVVPRTIGPRPWITVFDDPIAERGSDDLFFEPDPDGAEIPPRITQRLGVPRPPPDPPSEPMINPFE